MPSPSIFQEQHQAGMRCPSQHFLFGVLKYHRSAMSPTLQGMFPCVVSGCRWGKIVPERLHPILCQAIFIIFFNFIFPSDPFAEKPLHMLSRNLHGAQSRGGLRSMTPNQSQDYWGIFSFFLHKHLLLEVPQGFFGLLQGCPTRLHPHRMARCLNLVYLYTWQLPAPLFWLEI